MYLEIKKGEVYINKEAVSYFYYDYEDDAFILCVMDGRKFTISNETAENL
jgi:hypothetical protein